MKYAFLPFKKSATEDRNNDGVESPALQARQGGIRRAPPSRIHAGYKWVVYPASSGHPNSSVFHH